MLNKVYLCAVVLTLASLDAQAVEQKVKIIKQSVETPSIFDMIFDSFKPKF